MESKEMKNIKKPTYAVKLGNGKFIAYGWQCARCGKHVGQTNKPASNSNGWCTGTSSGHHIWIED